MKSAEPRVLVADDQADVRHALRLLLKGAGFAVVEASGPADAEARMRADEPDLALVDMNYTRDTTSGAEGLDLVAKLHGIAPTTPIVVMTAWGSVEIAVEAMKRGASDYVEKPWQNARLLTAVKSQIELASARRETAAAHEESARERRQALPEIVSASPAMRDVGALIARVAASDANVLVTGEHGTGKDVVARAIHARSNRSSKAFVVVNAGALADGVFESELFGHTRGAFTDAKTDRIGCFELADGGTLFLDEIGTMPLGQQAKLLRVLQSGDFLPVGSSRSRRADVRVVCATNVDIAREVAEGRFRQDLLYRINTVEIHLPPLRDRLEDLPLLVETFLAAKATRYQKTAPVLGEGALTALRAHAWPGNVRELEHTIERALVLSDGSRIDAAHLNLRQTRPPEASIDEMTLEQAERHLIQRALGRSGGNVIAAAEALGLSRSALYRRLAALKIKVSE